MSDYSDCDEPGAHGIVEAIERMKLSSSDEQPSRVSNAQPGESPLRDVSNRSSNGNYNSSTKLSSLSKHERASAIDLCSPSPPRPHEQEPDQEQDQENSAAPPSPAPSCAASASSAAAPSSKKLAPSSFNQLVREAKAAEERGDLGRALGIYRDQLAPLRPELETIAKKVRILTKKIKKQQRNSREQQNEEEQQDQEQAEEAPAAHAAAAASSAAEPRVLSLVLDGKFAFDAEHARYTLVRPVDPASASEDESSAIEAARASGEVSSVSSLLSPFSLAASLFDRIYPYQQEGIHWMFTHIHCPPAAALVSASAAAAEEGGGGGGILGDDMGLGKTVSTTVFLSGLFSSGLIRRALIIVPISVLEHWRAEILRWCGARDDEEEIAAAKGKGGLKIGAANANMQKKGLRLLSVYVGKRTPKQRAASELALTQLLSSPSATGIVLTTYGQFGAKPELFSAASGKWDYIVADEAHKLKNPDTQLHQKLHALPASHRLLLTGTPIMNDLDELWALMDLACSGLVFGSRKQFKTDFAARIMAGLAKCATTAEKEIGAQLTRKLKERMGPYMLRREKAQVKDQMSDCKLKQEREEKAEVDNEQDAEANPAAAAVSSIPRSLSSSSSASGSASSAHSILPRLSTQKNDLIIWLHLSVLQESLYRKFLSNDSVRSVFTTKSRGPLPALTALKKLCDHPRMIDPSMAYMETIAEDLRAMETLPGVIVPSKPVAAASAAAAMPGGVVAPASSSSSSRTKEIPQATAAALAEPGRPQLAEAVRMLCAESTKYACLESLLRMHLASGHRTLIFSQSLRMLGFITLLLAHLQMKCLRIDGTVSDPAERQRRVDLFNRDTSFHAFLLTTRSGAVGLNLTGASRVVIFDPDWTPSLDNQAVDRAYRIGQQRNVVVYRLISCGSVEEVIYRKQVFKGSIIRAATGVKQQTGAAAASVPVRAGSDPSSASAATDDTPTRYFGKDELREVFLFKSSQSSSAFDSLRRLHPPESQRKSYPELDELTRAIEAIPGVHGITDHDLMFSETAVKPEEMAAQDAAAAAAAVAAAQAAAAANAAASFAADVGDLDALSSSLLDDLSAQQPVVPGLAVASQLERKEDIEAIVAAATSRLEATIGAPRTPPRAKRTNKQKQALREQRGDDEAEESKEADEDGDTGDASSCDDSESTSSTPSQTGTITECDDRSVRGSPMESPPGGLPMHDDAEAEDNGDSVDDDSSANAVVVMAPLLDESVIDLTGSDEGVQAVSDRVFVKAEAEEKQEAFPVPLCVSVQAASDGVMGAEAAEEAELPADENDSPALDAGAMPVSMPDEADAEASAVDLDATLPYNKPESESDPAAAVSPLQPLPLLDGEQKENESNDGDFVLVSAESDVSAAALSEAMDSTLPYAEAALAEPMVESLSPAAIVAASAVAQSDPDASDCTLPFHPPSPGFLAQPSGAAADRPSVVFDLSLTSIRSSFASPGAAALLPPSLCEPAAPVLPALPASSSPGALPAVPPAADCAAAPAPVRAPSIGAAPVILQLADSSDDDDDNEADEDAETDAQQFEDAREWKENDEEQQPAIDTAASAAAAPIASYDDLMQRASQFDPTSSEGRLLQLECLLHAFIIDRSDPELQLRIFRLATETGLVAMLPVA